MAKPRPSSIRVEPLSGVLGTFVPDAVPNEKITPDTLVSAVIPASVIVNVAPLSRNGL